MSWLFAQMYDLFSRQEPAQSRRVRRQLVADLSGDILEIGVGTGLNFPYYAAAARVTATDPNPHMLHKARRQLSTAAATIAISEANVHALPFSDNHFDHAVCTLVLCSVPNVERDLAEIVRVTKPDGAARLIEHVRAESLHRARLQRWLTPFWKRIGAGCYLNRDTVGALRSAGFTLESVERLQDAPALMPTVAVRARIPSPA